MNTTAEIIAQAIADRDAAIRAEHDGPADHPVTVQPPIESARALLTLVVQTQGEKFWNVKLRPEASEPLDVFPTPLSGGVAARLVLELGVMAPTDTAAGEIALQIMAAIANVKPDGTRVAYEVVSVTQILG